jgi:hypothetical protein
MESLVDSGETDLLSRDIQTIYQRHQPCFPRDLLVQTNKLLRHASRQASHADLSQSSPWECYSLVSSI